MKTKLLQKLICTIWAFLLSFGLSLATTMCVVTAFHMAIDTTLLLQTCALAALVCAICYSLPLSLVPIGVGAAVLIRMWRSGIILSALEAFLNRLSRQYDRAYGWGIIRWSYRIAEEMEPELVYILCILGGMIALLTALSISRRTTALPALSLSLITLATCFVVNDTIPDTPWLYLLLLCFIVLIMTSYTRGKDEKQSNRLRLYVTPATALALLILFAAIPQDTYDRQDEAARLTETFFGSESMQVLLGHIDNGGATGTSDANTIDLKSVGYRMETQSPVLQVTAPFTGTLYLRGRAMDVYDGTSWQQSDISYDELYWPKDQLEELGTLTITTRFAHRMQYTPYYVDISDADISTGLINEEGLTEYSFPYLMPAEPPVISAETEIPDLDAYIRQESRVSNWAQPLASKLHTSQESIYQTARNIASYVRNSATYSTRTPRMPAKGKDFARWFLEDSNTGYCVHFATAATVLLQSAGIPARYVTGYYTQVTAGEQVTVYSDQAHAWAEYWLPGYGWTVLEATPPDFSQEPEATTEATVEATLPQTSADPTSPQSSIAPTLREPEPEVPSVNTDLILWLLTGIVTLSSLVTAAELQRRLRRLLRQKKLVRASPREKALLFWQETVLYARLLNEAPDRNLYRVAEMAKFSRHSITDAQLAQFEAYADAATVRLKKHNPFRRLYYRIILAIY